MLTSGFRKVVPWVGALALVAGSAATADAASAPATYAAGHVTTQTATGGAASDAVTKWPQVTGERLLDTPTTKPCVQTVVRNYAFKNTAYGPDKNFSGRYVCRPPAGPWARVVATISVHVTGVQFDRIGDIRLGDTDILRTRQPSLAATAPAT